MPEKSKIVNKRLNAVLCEEDTCLLPKSKFIHSFIGRLGVEVYLIYSQLSTSHTKKNLI